MTWNDQVGSMMNIWGETQKQLWESWYEMMRNAPTSAMTYTSLMDQWRKMATQGIEAWTSDAQPIAQRMSRQLLANQSAMMRFVELTSDAWKTIWPQVESGADWQATMRSYAEDLSKQLAAAPAGMLKSSQDVGEMWRLYLEEIQAVSQPWLSSLQRAPWHIGEAMTGSGSGSELIEMTSLYWDAYERTFGSLVESPSFGLTREINEKIAKAFDAWLDFRRVSAEYQAVLAGSWGDIFENVIKTLVNRAQNDQPVTGVRELVRIWTDTADSSLEQVFRTPEYVEIQGRLMDTAMKYRLQEQQVVELVLKTTYVPTRSEVDEAHRNIYELRKEVKALKRAMKGGPPGNGTDSSVSDLRKEITALKKELQAVREANGQG